MKRDVTIALSVRVSDGSFEATLSLPVTAEPEQLNNCVKAWLDAMRQAVALSTESAAPVTVEPPDVPF